LCFVKSDSSPKELVKRNAGSLIGELSIPNIEDIREQTVKQLKYTLTPVIHAIR